jgi:hypothetical protein
LFSAFVSKRVSFSASVSPLVIFAGYHVPHFVHQNVASVDVVVLLEHCAILAHFIQTALGSTH